MGRILTGGAGSSSSGSGIQPINTAVMTGEPIQAGDIITIGADNLGYRAMDPTVPGATLRPMSQAASILNGFQSPSTILSTASVVGGKVALAVLSNGNFVIASLAATTNYPQFTIYNQSGIPVLGPVLIDAVDASSAIAYLRMAPLLGGGFAIVYPGATVNVKYAVYDNTGTVVKAATQIEGEVIYSTTIAALADGGFVAGWAGVISTISQPRFARFNAAGVLQGAITQIDTNTFAGVSGGEGLSLAALVGGGFVAAYNFSNTSNTSTRFARFSAAGALQGVQTQYGTSIASSASIAYQVHVTALTDGGFVAAQNSLGSSVGSQIAKYDATGTIVGAAFTMAGGTISLGQFAGMRMMARAGGGYSVVWANSPSVFLATFNSAAVQVGSTITVGANGTSPVNITAMPDGGAVVGYAQQNLSFFVRYDSSLNVAGPTMALGSAANTNFYAASLVNPVLPSAITFIGLTAGGTTSGTNGIGCAFSIFNASVQRMTLAGVATASAAQGAVVPVQYVGSAAIRTGFNQPYSINSQGNTVPGQKMSIVGNNAIMLGVQ